MTLNDNFYWHDRAPLNGRAVTVQDALYTEERFKSMSANALSWSNVVSKLEAIDEKTMRLNLSKPFAPIFNLLGSAEHMKFIPPEIVEDETVAEHPVGSGPWMFDSFTPDVELTWTANPNWHTEGLPIVDNLVLAMINDPSTILANLQGGAFDFSLLDFTVYGTAKEQIPELTYSFNGDQIIGGIYYNFAVEPFQDMRVRQAMMFAQDRDGVNAAIDKTGEMGWMSGIPEIAPFNLNPKDPAEFGRNAEYHQRDVARSVQLLDAAGYPDGIDVVVHGTAAYGDTWNLLFDTTLATIRDAGIRTRRENKEYAAYIATTFIGDFESDGDPAMAIGPLKVVVEPDDCLYTNYHPDSGRKNFGAGPGDISSHPTMLDDFERQRVELDLASRIDIINEIQRDMAEANYLSPWIARVGVSGKMPHVMDYYYKSSFRFGTETLPRVWLDPSLKA
jgi:peptide/nickel transport system substrate-binding protein